MKTGTGQFAPFRWTNENLFDAAAYSRCPTARSRNQQNYIKIFAAQPVEKKCQDTTASETDARLQDCQCDYDNLGYALNR